jgi:ribosomal protein S18 acetylase RimI-like enzyme
VTEPLRPGHFWKTPFVWEPGCPEPGPADGLAFEPAPQDWLHGALAAVMADSLDESDRYAVEHGGPAIAASELLAIAPQHFELRDGWWLLARDAERHAVGFVLPVLFKQGARWKGDRPEGTIFYMGVLPAHRGHGHAVALLGEATRTFQAAGCSSALCDTGETNRPMVAALRRAGYRERSRWQRKVA